MFHDFEHPGDPNGYPDIELLYQGGSIVSDLVLRKDFGITDEIYDYVFKPIENIDSFMVAIFSLKVYKSIVWAIFRYFPCCLDLKARVGLC